MIKGWDKAAQSSRQCIYVFAVGYRLSFSKILNMNLDMKSVKELIDVKANAGVQLTDRELAIRWYSRITEDTKLALLGEYLPSFTPSELTDENKYWLFLAQQKL
jgi:hypothetical protein